MIPFFRPDVGEGEVDLIREAMENGVLSTGERVSTFESTFAEFVDREYAAAVNSGSTALELALEVSELEPGAGILVSPFNCSAVLYAIQRAGLEPVFVDINADTFNMDSTAARRVLQKVDSSVDGLLITHLYGQMCDMDPLIALSIEYDLTVIEDFAQAPGATYDCQPAGSFGQFGVGSFGATKNITTAEGGIVVGDSQSRIHDVKSRRDNNDIDQTPPPRSVRMNDIEAAIGIAQLERYETMVEARRELAAVYRDQLPASVSCQSRLPETEPVYHRFPVRIDDRNGLESSLNAAGIETARVIETPLYEFDCVQSPRVACPETEKAVETGVHLPMHSNLSRADATTIVDAVRAFSSPL